MKKQKKKRTKAITAKRVQASDDQPFIPHVDVKPEVDEEAWGEDGLTVRQRAFVDALLGPAGGIATKAAEMAGYASDNRNALKVTACRLLTYANVQQAIAHARAAKLGSPEWVKSSLVDLASSTITPFLIIHEDGSTEIDFAKAAEAGALGQIREYREESIKIDGSPAQIIKRNIKLHDRRAALETLAKIDGKIAPASVNITNFDLTGLAEDELRNFRDTIEKISGGNRITEIARGD